MSSFASGLKATDPRDYIYGLLAITAIPVVPDYNKTVSDVYIEYVAAWVDTCRDIGTNRLITPLGFLSHAGVGIYGSEANLPSWALNFPGDGELRVSIIKMETGCADKGVFGDDASKLPFVIARTKNLFAWGIQVDMVCSVAEGPVYSPENDVDLLESAITALSQGKRYKTGPGALNAFFRLLHRDHARTVSRSTVIRDLSLFYHMTKSLDRLDPQKRAQMLRILGFSTDPVEFEARFRKCFAPGADFRQLGFARNLRDIMMDESEGMVSESWQRIKLDLIRLEDTWRLISTTRGYLGLAPLGTAVGDALCVLKGSDVPVLLRRTDLGSYTVVGTTFVEGLMRGEAAELEQSERGMRQWFQMQ